MERVHENRQKNPEKWREYAEALPQEYVPTTTFTWDQEAEDSYPIVLPQMAVWNKRGHYITHMHTNVDVPHDGIIDAGWKYRMICWNPDAPLPFEEQMRLHSTSIHADDEEGIQRRFEQLRALYGTNPLQGVCVDDEESRKASEDRVKVVYGVSIENVAEEIARVNEKLRLMGQNEADLLDTPAFYYYKNNIIDKNNKIDYKNQEEEEEEEDPCPVPIKNQPERSEELLDEWHLAHPPKLRRQRCDDLVEKYDGVDKRLEWLSGLMVEEEDNEEKNSETFGP
jgi:hypothetical protein